MSDNWVGPGWWMASDGKWYPPRTPIKDDKTMPTEPTRWSRRTPDGRPVEGATELSSSESEAEQTATRAERATQVPRPEPVSIKRPAEIGPVEIEEEFDLREEVDLRDAEVTEPHAFEMATPLTSAASDDKFGITPPDDKAVKRSSLEHLKTSGSGRKPIAYATERAADPTIDRNFSSGGRSNGSIRTDADAEQGSMEPSDEESSAHTPDPEELVNDEDPSVVVDRSKAGDESEPGERVEIEEQGDASSRPGPTPLQHAVLPALIDRQPEERSSSKGLVLLVLATVLAVLSGVLGAFWLRERSVANDLRDELALVSAVDDVSSEGLTALNDEVRTLRFQNDELQTRLDEMSALVLELPAGRVTEIAVPFTPVFADEIADGDRERLIAVSSDGQYVVWADGVDGSITGSGSLTGSPTGLFAATSKAWIMTDAATIDVVSLLPDGEGLPTVDFGPVSFVAPEERAYWTYEPASGDVVRLKKSDGGVTASASVPVPVVDLTIGAGSVWALGDDGRVYRINTADFTVQAIDAGADLISITAGPDALWTLSAADGSLRRVDAVSGEVLVTVPVGRDPIDATFAGSSVWVALRSGTSLIEVDTRTAAVISRTALPGVPTALHQGDSGVFVTLEGDVPLVRVASLTLPINNANGDGDGDGDDADADAG